VSSSDQPVPAYSDVEQENDPGAGAGIATEAPAEPGTVAEAPEQGAGRDGSGGDPVRAPEANGFPSGPTDTPPADSGAGTPAPENSDDQFASGEAGSDPATWPRHDGRGVSGSAAGAADLESPGGLTTHDTEE
jgi:hypothetical protein